MKKRRRIIFLFSIFLISLVTIFFLKFKNNNPIYNVNYSLSQKEKKDLELFFYDLLASNELAYTLFGDKPMSFCIPKAYKPRFSNSNFTYKIYLDGTKPLFRGLYVWKTLASKIKKSNYLLIIFEDKNYPTFAILVNKNAFRIEFNKNIDLFQKYYGPQVTAESILNSLGEKGSDYNEVFDNSFLHVDVLLGIMLGFGRHNAELYQRREELAFPKPPLFFPTPSGGYPTPSDGFLSTEAEIKYLGEHLQFVQNKSPLFFSVTPVCFVGDRDDPETHILVKKYDTLHKKLIAIFEQKDWLAIVLHKLSANQ